MGNEVCKGGRGEAWAAVSRESRSGLGLRHMLAIATWRRAGVCVKGDDAISAPVSQPLASAEIPAQCCGRDVEAPARLGLVHGLQVGTGLDLEHELVSRTAYISGNVVRFTKAAAGARCQPQPRGDEHAPEGLGMRTLPKRRP